MNSIGVLVIGSDSKDGLAARLARMGHNVLCASASDELPPSASWDVVALDDRNGLDPLELAQRLPRGAAPMMVVGEDPRRVSGAGPVVFVFRDESDAGYSRAIHMCAALGATDKHAIGETDCADAGRGSKSSRGWQLTRQPRIEVRTA